jgi:hypothetical protein
MKYKELTTEEARRYCKKYKAKCDKCPLRRTSNTGRTLFCYYVLMEIVDDIEKLEMDEETIEHYEELGE